MYGQICKLIQLRWAVSSKIETVRVESSNFISTLWFDDQSLVSFKKHSKSQCYFTLNPTLIKCVKL